MAAKAIRSGAPYHSSGKVPSTVHPSLVMSLKIPLPPELSEVKSQFFISQFMKTLLSRLEPLKSVSLNSQLMNFVLKAVHRPRLAFVKLHEMKMASVMTAPWMFAEVKSHSMKMLSSSTKLLTVLPL